MFIFFIDGASFISLDGNWYYFMVYCENKVYFPLLTF
jgi:GNAT superfamily N-acetyltransferase